MDVNQRKAVTVYELWHDVSRQQSPQNDELLKNPEKIRDDQKRFSKLNIQITFNQKKNGVKNSVSKSTCPSEGRNRQDRNQ